MGSQETTKEKALPAGGQEWPDTARVVRARWALVPLVWLFALLFWLTPDLRYAPYASLGGASFLTPAEQFSWALPLEWREYFDVHPPLPSRLHHTLHGLPAAGDWLGLVGRSERTWLWTLSAWFVFGVCSAPLFWLGIGPALPKKEKLERLSIWFLLVTALGWMILSALDFLLAAPGFVHMGSLRTLFAAGVILLLALLALYKSWRILWARQDLKPLRRGMLLGTVPAFLLGVLPFWVHGGADHTLAVFVPTQGWRVTRNIPGGGVVQYRGIPWSRLHTFETRRIQQHLGHEHYPVSVDKSFPDGCRRKVRIAFVQTTAQTHRRVVERSVFMAGLKGGHEFQADFEQLVLDYPDAQGNYQGQEWKWFVFTAPQSRDQFPWADLESVAQRLPKKPDPCYCPMEIDYKSLHEAGARLQLKPLTSLSALRVKADGRPFTLPSLFPWQSHNAYQAQGLTPKVYKLPSLEGTTLTLPAPTEHHPQYDWLVEEGLYRPRR